MWPETWPPGGVAEGAADLGAAAEMEEVTEDLKGQ